jgi:AraC-like DNA-binding protein
MSNANIAKEIVSLLKKHNFPNAYTADEIQQQAHAIVYAVTTQVLSAYGSRLLSLAEQGFYDPGAQGTGGGGGPHHWELLIQYVQGAAAKTKQVSADILNSAFH